ncbi:hypothetical protein RRF57_009739 [Xylaria bambusicola]|uniref:Uncharacterized protein n=1 Tax=Xylaria bambusicola TaxID=326684 RepID=A0AAN7Z222_9PEZI
MANDEAPLREDGGGPRFTLRLGAALGTATGKGKSGIDPTDERVEGLDDCVRGVIGLEGSTFPEL